MARRYSRESAYSSAATAYPQGQIPAVFAGRDTPGKYPRSYQFPVMLG